ncbi:MAG: arsenite methyltransferase [Rhodospirillales bacterium]|nr:arsenite methyltransferase [Rhodospirillales bacterium]
MDDPEIKEMVRNRYGSIASGGCCGGDAPCGGDVAEQSRKMGYSEADLQAAGEGANLGLGCGNPQAIALLRVGEVVVDLGSGAGFDCFLSARAVGPSGRVIGVDMTHEMLARARANAARLGLENVEFRLGEISFLPVADGIADVVISNCVINLVPEKEQVFREAFRVLKPGGRLAVSDVVNIAPLPPELAADRALVSGCVAGAASVPRLEAMLRAAGFASIRIVPKAESRDLVASWAPGRSIEDYVASASMTAEKPRT